eukprot:m.120856 g.120856  ORF g.120856 m.120856 type:complete len:123 (+) comp13691_c0_seq28:2434-2802(+)
MTRHGVGFLFYKWVIDQPLLQQAVDSFQVVCDRFRANNVAKHSSGAGLFILVNHVSSTPIPPHYELNISILLCMHGIYCNGSSAVTENDITSIPFGECNEHLIAWNTTSQVTTCCNADGHLV